LNEIARASKLSKTEFSQKSVGVRRLF